VKTNLQESAAMRIKSKKSRQPNKRVNTPLTKVMLGSLQAEMLAGKAEGHI